MPRDIPIGNGNLLITFDSRYTLRDLYFPYVGKENHTMGHLNRFGIWVDGQMSWMHEPDWQKRLKYEAETLVTDVTATQRRQPEGAIFARVLLIAHADRGDVE